MSSLDNNPFWCEKHGFTEVITSAGVGSVPKKRCPFCRAESLETALEAVRGDYKGAVGQLVDQGNELYKVKTALEAVRERINEVDDLLDGQGTTSDLDEIYQINIAARILLDADAGKPKP